MTFEFQIFDTDTNKELTLDHDNGNAFLVIEPDTLIFEKAYMVRVTVSNQDVQGKAVVHEANFQTGVRPTI